MNRKYEIGFIVNPEATDEEVKKIADTMAGIIEKADGTVESIDEWGRKRLAYPIQKHDEGIYTFINTSVKGTAFIEIERRLKQNEKVLRFIVLRLDERLKKSNRLIKKWKRMEKFSRKHQESSRKDEGENYVRDKERADAEQQK